MKRRSYADSCRELERQGWIKRAPPQPPPRRPQPGDDGRGISFLRTSVSDATLSHLTIPRTFFGRSEVARTSFHDTDLSESTLCWNDFIDVDFKEASLVECDLRASLFERVDFRDADLSGADMRRSSFVDCSFVGTQMTDAKLTSDQIAAWFFSDVQRKAIDWQDDEGEEPEGG